MSTTPWGSTSMNPSPVALTPSSEAGPSSSNPTSFSSTWGAFGLPQPTRNATQSQPSNLTMQLESHPIDQTSLTLFQRRAQQPLSSSSSGQGNAFGSGRRPSTLGLNESAMMEDEDERSDALLQLSSSLRKLSGDISMSATFDPVLPSSAFTMSSRSARSRSASESASNHPFQPPPPPLFSNVPPSPVTVARALQAGQKTPPAMFQRRLFKDDHMLDDGSNSEARSSRSGSSSDVGSISNSQFSTRDKGKRKATLSDMLQDEDDEIEELSVGLSRSTSGTTDEMDSARVVRRPVSRKPNLLPKSKSHLRVLSELRSESAPADLSAEIASEATLHRLSRSGASTVPPLRPSSLPGGSSTHPHSHHFDSSGSSLPSATHNLLNAAMRPTPNRFPEQAEEDDPLLISQISENSSSDEDNVDQDDAGVSADLEIGSDWGGASTNGGYETGPDDMGGSAMNTEEATRKMQMVWNGIRSGGGSKTSMNAASMAKSPGSGSRSSTGMEVENPFNIPQTPSAAFTTRPGKRKNIEDRFEPYSHALKRRAVSPAASSLSLSPGFAAQNPSSSTIPIAPLTSTLPVSIPSPTLSATSHHQNFFTSIHQTSRSVAGSPVASSLSSSAGRTGGFGYPGFGIGGGLMSERYRTPSTGANMGEERIKMDSEIEKMSLGGSRAVGGEEEEL